MLWCAAISGYTVTAVPAYGGGSTLTMSITRSGDGNQVCAPPKAENNATASGASSPSLPPANLHAQRGRSPLLPLFNPIFNIFVAQSS